MKFGEGIGLWFHRDHARTKVKKDPRLLAEIGPDIEDEIAGAAEPAIEQAIHPFLLQLAAVTKMTIDPSRRPIQSERPGNSLHDFGGVICLVLIIQVSSRPFLMAPIATRPRGVPLLGRGIVCSDRLLNFGRKLLGCVQSAC
jgi:hypothetical protein